MVVANGEKQPDLTSILCFLTKPGQGVNYARGDWHHPLIALGDESDFLVIDRAGADTDDTFIALGHMTVAWVGYQGSRARATVHRV